MNIRIERPFAISEKGGRMNNEDSVFPLSELVTSNQKLFIVCDGVGGAEKGEIASALACESFQTFFSTFIDGDPTEEFINKAVHYTETRFDEYVQAHPEAKGMATTLTMVYIGKSGITIAHIGDSRIYQFRKGEAIFQTEDHSLVNSLVKLGQITKDEAKTYPKKNVITRAIGGTDCPTEAEVTLITDIQAGDYFFMCTDGVTECVMNDALAQIFMSSASTENIKNTIVESCSKKARDNYSFYILPIQNVQNSISYKQFILSFLYTFI
ncbi:MAG: protein phosphatase 2C domain-containing protein [Tannerella sp.]|jgi:protein phosphatase|nr:protein phosphatase 2C domain-containing protein [Tannerella sp.]